MTEYDNGLGPLLNWIRDHPGLTKAELEKTIRAIPYPDGDPRDWKPPYDGTRLDWHIPTVTCLEWKLRFLELRGDIKQCGFKRGSEKWESNQ